jgi:8-oxo-dGTP pyrophosphatase MutT (NUDIX family)
MPIDIVDLPNPRNPARPAATVVLARDTPAGLEVLMIRRGAATAFGGMWAFPGGVIEEGDIPPGGTADPLPAARHAAVREALEEVALVIDPDSLAFWSHWVPPDAAPRRFSTWFFVAPASDAHEAVGIDGHEVDDHRWITPADALTLVGGGEIELAPPTIVTLAGLSRFADTASAVAAADPTYYVTHARRSSSGATIYMWDGDIAYDGGDCDVEGPRNRVVADDENGWHYINTIA